MRRWAWLKTGLLVVALAAAAVAVVGWVVKREPEFYAQAAAVAPKADDPKVASETEQRIGELLQALVAPYNAPGEWQVNFTADELNAFLREDADHVVLLRPKWEEFADPRVSIQGDRLLVGGRVGSGFFSTVLSVEVRAWLVDGEPNTLAIELVSVRLGSLPWFKRWLMDRMTEYAAKNKADVTWYRGAANPVAICRLRADQNQPDLALTAVSIADGRVAIAGKGLLGQ